MVLIDPDPTPTEWIALIGFLIFTLIPVALFGVYTVAASLHALRLLHQRSGSRISMPWFNDIFYGCMLFLQAILITVGIWFAWRQGWRVENGKTPDTDSDFTNTGYFWTLFLYVLYNVFYVFLPWKLFVCGMQRRWFLWAALYHSVVWLLLLTTGIIAFAIYWVPAVLLLIAAFFALYQLFVTWSHVYFYYTADGTHSDMAYMLVSRQLYDQQAEAQSPYRQQPNMP